MGENLKMIKLPTLFCAIGCLIATTTTAKELTADVEIIDISDGDTVKVILNNEETSIRLLDVDCFETKANSRAKKQAKYYNMSIDEIKSIGNQSKEILKALLKDKNNIIVKWYKRDSFGRILGNIYTKDDINVNEYMLNTGKCKKYIDFNKRK